MTNTSSEPAQPRNRLAETARTLIEALLIAMLIRTFLFQPFNIPSGSMEPTLLVVDYLFVSKFSYGYSRYSLPLSLPLFSGRIFGAPVQRGDVVVFRLPSDDAVDYIKRVIGLPGDHIQVIDGTLHINGTSVQRERLPDFVGENACGTGAISRRAGIEQWRETLPSGVSYNTLHCTSFNGFPDTTPAYIVPPGHYFMMGDNRENSRDSRFPDVGFVPVENIVGRAQAIFFSIGDDLPAWHIWQWPWSVRWSRVPEVVR